MLSDRRTWLVGGTVEVIPEKPNPLFTEVLMPAWTTRELIQNRRWKKAVAYHATEPLLRWQEFGIVHAVETLTREGLLTGLALTPYLAEEDDGFVPPTTRLKCYQALVEKRLLGKGDKDVQLWKQAGYDLNDQVVLLGLGLDAFHAGPREAVFHALCRQNMGFTHLVVERDHAGARCDDGTPLFTPEAAQEAFAGLEGELRIEAVPVGEAGYFAELGRVDLTENHARRGWEPLALSHAEFREMLEKGETPDPRLMRPETAHIVRADHDLYRNSVATNVTWHHASINKEDREALANHQGVCLWFTGLSASGKSTVAQRVESMLYERGIRTYILDGDNVRQGLNANLGFSPRIARKTSAASATWPSFSWSRAWWS